MALSQSAARGWQVLVGFLAVILIVTFFLSHCDVIDPLGLGLKSWSCSGPLGFEQTVPFSSTDSEFVARLFAYGIYLLVGGGVLAIIFYILQRAMGQASE